MIFPGTEWFPGGSLALSGGGCNGCLPPNFSHFPQSPSTCGRYSERHVRIATQLLAFLLVSSLIFISDYSLRILSSYLRLYTWECPAASQPLFQLCVRVRHAYQCLCCQHLGNQACAWMDAVECPKKKNWDDQRTMILRLCIYQVINLQNPVFLVTSICVHSYWEKQELSRLYICFPAQWYLCVLSQVLLIFQT